MKPLLSEFVRVDRRNRCPVCGHPDWCLVSRDGTRAICPRTISAKQWGDAGYLHILSEPLPEVRRPIKRPAPAANGGARVDWEEMVSRMEVALDGEPLAVLADSLGVTARSLALVYAGWCGKAGAYTFPMFDGRGRMVGVRLRRPDGVKYAVTGSRNGLFIPKDLGGNCPLLIVEGPTDTAALLDLGFDAIGRPSCSGCVAWTVEFCRGRYREVVVVEDHDDPKRRPDGSVFYPGQEGAAKLADALAEARMGVKVISPLGGVKDARDWKARGVTRATVELVIDNAKWWSRR